ncbi:MAG: hypothetical protein ITG02_14855 [Patulibacter sp.]|nr:hypothetical protein [Patulibacter sp.]
MRRALLRPWALTALIGLVYLLVAPPTTDLAAQAHRTALAERGVWSLDFSWFGGHHLPSYSVLSPLLGDWLGTLLVGVLAAVAGAWAFERLVGRTWGPGSAWGRAATGSSSATATGADPGSDTGATAAAWWFAGGIGALLFTGRITFLLGLGIGLVALLCLTARPGRTLAPAVGAIAGATLTALASPVAALFLALVGAAVAAGRVERSTRWTALLLAGIAFAAALALAVAFPGGGTEPFVPSALFPAIAALLVVLVALPRDQRGLRVGVALYLAGIVLAGVLDTPMGGNATRLGALVGGPLLVAALWGRRPLVVAVLALPFLYWQLYPPVRDAAQAWSDDSARAAYWQPADRALRALVAAEPGRVDVPPTARRGEARWISPEVPLARGWIRQLDRHRNALFYGDGDHDAAPISAADYRGWLDANAIRWVALPDAPPDYASRRVVALLRSGAVPGLTRVWGDEHWTVWRVEGARPLVAPEDGRAEPNVRVTDLGADRLSFTGAVDGVPLRVRLRWSPYLRITAGRACLHEDEDGWTRVVPRAPGRVSVGSGLPGPWHRSPPVACAP